MFGLFCIVMIVLFFVVLVTLRIFIRSTRTTGFFQIYVSASVWFGILVFFSNVLFAADCPGNELIAIGLCQTAWLLISTLVIYFAPLRAAALPITYVAGCLLLYGLVLFLTLFPGSLTHYFWIVDAVFGLIFASLALKIKRKVASGTYEVSPDQNPFD
jgi:hypothetical protein